ncbi:MAG: hypothetical protein HY342_01890 [Candidatus Lambdaproteobacteria bacterium]|nr:hypothetical protein [Candidatus Lambdaproteobacteria bacterium]
MYAYVLSLHITASALVIGSLFMQSLMVVMVLRLKNPEHVAGTRIIQRRMHWFIYYPILAVALLSGLWVAWATETLGQKWLHWKLVLVVLLIGLGFLTGHALRKQAVPKPFAMAVHIVIFLVALCLVYFAALKPV